MSCRVFHEPGPWAEGQRLRLSVEESRYLLRVRRARVGAAVELLDGESAHWDAHLVQIDGHTAVLELGRARAPVTVVPLGLLLVVPEPRATLDTLTLACELGCTAIHLIPGEHSPGGLPSAPRIARTLRAAQRQCGRPHPPPVVGPTTLAAALQATAGPPGFYGSIPDRLQPEATPVDPGVGARLLVGPEGGLAAPERAMAAAAGFRPLSLGPWVLRTPTAVAAGLSRLLAQAQLPAPGPAEPPRGA